MIKYIPLIGLIYAFTINLITFILYYSDKKYATKKQGRISEFMLLSFGFLGGSIGSIFGMLFFHHKTKKWKFRLLCPLFLAMHFALLVVIF